MKNLRSAFFMQNPNQLGLGNCKNIGLEFENFCFYSDSNIPWGNSSEQTQKHSQIPREFRALQLPKLRLKGE